jgi:hypothetical protein
VLDLRAVVVHSALECQAAKFPRAFRQSERRPENDIPKRSPLTKDSIISTTTMAT